jgi:hypothetical protein
MTGSSPRVCYAIKASRGVQKFLAFNGNATNAALRRKDELRQTYAKAKLPATLPRTLKRGCYGQLYML